MKQTIKTWLDRSDLPDELRAELLEMERAPQLYRDAFGSELEFGTSGLRGIMGAGTGRMNLYVIRKVTQGLADYIHSTGSRGEEHSVAIGYDSRIHSLDFAEETAAVLCANGIKTYIFPEIVPVAALSFAVRRLGCDMGVMITASHNPREYNGYKVYGKDGCQIIGSVPGDILTACENIHIFDDVKYIGIGKALKGESAAPCLWIEDSLTREYLDCAVGESIPEDRTDAVRKQTENLHVVYTPLNGAGRKFVSEALQRIGVGRIAVPESQKHADGNFPTCPYPNPEKREAYSRAIALAQEENADLIIATDPDCDRVGAAVPIAPMSAAPMADAPAVSQILNDPQQGPSSEISREPEESPSLLTVEKPCGTQTPGGKMQYRQENSYGKNRGERGNNRENECESKCEREMQEPRKIPQEKPEYRLLTGNELGVLLLDFLCRMKSAGLESSAGTFTAKKSGGKNPVMIRSIVSTPLADKIAESFGVGTEITLTGFKYICRFMEKMEMQGRGADFLFGFEESNGYLTGMFTRDKDGVSTAALVCCMAAWHKSRGCTLLQALEEIYRTHGYYRNESLSAEFKGSGGAEDRKRIMEDFRRNPPEMLAGIPAVGMTDYSKSWRERQEFQQNTGNGGQPHHSRSFAADENGEGGNSGERRESKGNKESREIKVGEAVQMSRAGETGEISETFPPADMLELHLDDGSSCIIRPSGTEPKLKIYTFVTGKNSEESGEKSRAIAAALLDEIEARKPEKQRTE